MSKKCVAGTFATVLCLLILAPSALAGPPTHLPLPALDIAGLNHVCATAVDPEGDVYVASLGESKIKVFDSEHNLLASIPNASEPCGLAVDSRGTLYASEKASGKVVKYVPDAFPLSSSPSYGSAETVDDSGEAKGIAVDLEDDRLYVAAGDHAMVYQRDGTSGQDEVQEILVLPAVTGGTFKLEFAGEETAPIEVVPGAEPKPSDGEIEKALEALPAIDAGNVEVEAGDSDRSHLVTFTHALGSQNLLPLAVNSGGLSGGEVVVENVTQGFAFNGIIGEGELGDAVAISSYTYELNRPESGRYLSVADAASDTVKVLAGPDFRELKLSQEIDGTSVPDSQACPNCSAGFGPLDSAALAADQANGHLFVYDIAHEVVDEFEATGQHYLDQVSSPSFTAEPASVAAYPEQDEILHLNVQATGGSFTLGFDGQTTAPIPVVGASSQPSGAEIEAALESLPAVGAGNVSVFGEYNPSFASGSYSVHFTGPLGGRDVPPLKPHSHGLTGGSVARARVTSERDGSGPGRLYVSSGPGAGDELLAFGPLAPPSRAPLPELSQALEDAGAVRTDSVGNVYLSVGAEVRVYSPNGQEIAKFQHPRAIRDLAVDSTGKVYVIAGEQLKNEVTYYTPNAYPPASGTQYARHEPVIYSPHPLDAAETEAVALTVSPVDGRVFLLLGARVVVLDSAAHGSGVLDESFGSSLSCCDNRVFGGSTNRGIDVYGANGNVYISQGGLISVVDPTGTKILAQIGGRGSPRGKLSGDPAIAVDQSNGHVLSFSSNMDHAREYEATGAFVTEFGPVLHSPKSDYRIAIDNACALHDPPLTETTTPTCAEFDPAAGNAYVAYDAMTAFGPLAYGEAPAAVTGIATGLGLGNGGATLNGTADPRGFELEDCRFEYLNDGEYQQNVSAEEPAFSGAQAVACVPGLAEIGKGSKQVPVHADIGGLDPEGRYRFRLVAENEFGPAEGKAGLFGPPLLTVKSALPILYDEATLRAGVDPSGLQTTYRFQYGKAAGEYDQSTPSEVLPPGDGQVAVKAALTGLAEGTEYHFRFVAENEAKTVLGPDQTLITLERAEQRSCPNAEYRTGLSANLPDCRAYELVTPAEANGALIGAPPVNGAQLGFNNWLVVPRGAGAGEAITFGATTTLLGFEGSGQGDGYRAQRDGGAHPAGGWGIEILSPSYAQGAENDGGARNGASDQLYSFWHTTTSSESEKSLPKGTYLRVPGVPAPSCTPQPQSHFELAGCASLGSDSEASAEYVSAGGSHVIFSSRAQLEEAAAPAGTKAIYDRVAGAEAAQVLSLAPDGAPFGAGEDANYLAASEDGSAVVFRVGGTLYLHRDGESVEVAEAPSTFAGLAEDGSRVFYAAGSSGGAPARLFACEVKAGPCAGPGAQSATEIAPDSIFVSVSLDGSAALFTSKTVLPGVQANENGEAAEAEKRNLYAWDAESGAVRFVAILDSADFSAFGDNNFLHLGQWVLSITAPRASGRGRGYSPTRSTPDGVFVFQSHARLTAYDNEGKGEIYRYQLAAAPDKRLLCVSCDPSGAPPSADAALESLGPGAPLSVAPMTIVPNVTDDGSAVFFESFDRLLPEDANDALDVYEWRAQGAGDCKRSGGCLALISSGQGEYDSYLYGMSADGHDVFVRTPERILPLDVAGSLSLYDARVGGGIPDPVPAAPCQGDSCQGNGAPLPALPAPASSGGSDGNLAPEGAQCRKGKRKVKGRCVKPHKKRHRTPKHKRANHDRRAQR